MFVSELIDELVCVEFLIWNMYFGWCVS